MRFTLLPASLIFFAISSGCEEKQHDAVVLSPTHWMEQAESATDADGVFTLGLLAEGWQFAGDAEKASALREQCRIEMRAKIDGVKQAAADWAKLTPEEQQTAHGSLHPRSHIERGVSSWSWLALAPIAARDEAEVLAILDERRAWLEKAVAAAPSVKLEEVQDANSSVAYWCARAGMHELAVEIAGREPTKLLKLRTLESVATAHWEQGRAEAARPLYQRAFELALDHTFAERKRLTQQGWPDGTPQWQIDMDLDNAEYYLFSVAQSATRAGAGAAVASAAGDEGLPFTQEDRQRLSTIAEAGSSPYQSGKLQRLTQEVAILHDAGSGAVIKRLNGRGKINGLDLDEFAYEAAYRAAADGDADLMRSLDEVIAAADAGRRFRAYLYASKGLSGGPVYWR